MNRNHLVPVVAFLAALNASAQSNATIGVTDSGTGSPVENATVQLDGNSQTTDALGQTVFTGLADGTYEYTVSAICYTTGIGSITIAGGDASAELALEPVSTNNVFFFIGSPLAITGATVQLTDGADYNVSFVTSDPFGGEIVADVPFGEYSYTITIPCYATTTGTFTVDCNNGDGIAVFIEPTEANNVFFFIGSPLAITGATVQLTDGADYNVSFVTSDPFGGEIVADVPFGEYSYTITIPCYETTTGTFTVDCNNGDGIAVFIEPVEIVIDATVTLDGAVLSAAAAGLAYQWVDCDNSNAPVANATEQSFEPTEDGNYAVVISSGDCSVTSACTAVVITGTAEVQGREAFRVYPNPFTDRFTVRTDARSGTVRVQLYNADGRLVLEQAQGGAERIAVRTAQFPSGTYVLRVITDKGTQSLRLVK